jgi:hypothetical protein
MRNDIDFVVPWVDGNDPEWRKKYDKYIKNVAGEQIDATEIRYRDWDNLRYWFRGVEKFAPWVRKVHFITCGHYPKWLNLNALKLNFVKHSDYISEEYLPIFNANPIEINMHRIKGLSDKFVYFNDDTFIINQIKPERFFKNDLPVDIAVFNTLTTTIEEKNIAVYMQCNNIRIIQKYFKKNHVLKSNLFKWFNILYGDKLLRTIALLPWTSFTGFLEPHLPNAFLKSTFEKIWEKEESFLSLTSSHRFRDINDINQWVFRYWQLVEGNFYPYNVFKDSLSCNLNDLDWICKLIKNQKKSIICLNDQSSIDFEEAKQKINNSFKLILPERSSFELD